jgi:hypothetical protein
VSLPEDGDFVAPSDDTPRWAPDDQLLPALLAGSTTIRYADLARGDRAWAIAGLRLNGVTAEAIADQMDCSLRQVRAVAAEPAAILARFYMVESEAFADTLRMLQGDLARLSRELTETAAERDRYKGHLGRMIDAALVGDLGPTFARCGHPKTRYNTYTAPKTGKTSCRMCHAEAQAEYRARLKAASSAAPVGTLSPWPRATDHAERAPACAEGGPPSPDAGTAGLT